MSSVAIAKALLLFTAVNAALAESVIVRTEINVMNVMKRSSQAIDGNPQRSIQCFQMYGQLLTEVSNIYENQYNSCIDRAKQEEAALISSMENNKYNLKKDQKTTCEAFDFCDHIALLEYFDCFADKSRKASKDLISIEGQAREHGQNIRKYQETISRNQYLCTDEAYTVYADRLNALNSELESCLEGNDPWPQSTPPPPDYTPTTLPPDGPGQEMP